MDSAFEMWECIVHNTDNILVESFDLFIDYIAETDFEFSNTITFLEIVAVLEYQIDERKILHTNLGKDPGS